MEKGKSDIYVYADWKGLDAPTIIGVLSAPFAKGKKAFSFEYERAWLKSKSQCLFDPDIDFFFWRAIPDKQREFWHISRQHARHLGKNLNETQGSSRCKS